MHEPRELKDSVRAQLDRLQYWERRRESNTHDAFAVGERVWYKDERIDGVVAELLDREDGRKTLVGYSGAMVSFGGHAPVPVYLWALRRPDETP